MRGFFHPDSKKKSEQFRHGSLMNRPKRKVQAPVENGADKSQRLCCSDTQYPCNLEMKDLTCRDFVGRTGELLNEELYCYTFPFCLRERCQVRRFASVDGKKSSKNQLRNMNHFQTNLSLFMWIGATTKFQKSPHSYQEWPRQPSSAQVKFLPRWDWMSFPMGAKWKKRFPLALRLLLPCRFPHVFAALALEKLIVWYLHQRWFLKEIVYLANRTPWKTNMAPENDPWKRRFLLETIIIRGVHVSFRVVYCTFIFPMALIRICRDALFGHRDSLCDWTFWLGRQVDHRCATWEGANRNQSRILLLTKSYQAC